jgi:hypothetical protein
MIRTRAALMSTQALSAALMAGSSAEAEPASSVDINKHNISDRMESNITTNEYDRNLFNKHIWEKVCTVHKKYEKILIQDS